MRRIVRLAGLLLCAALCALYGEEGTVPPSGDVLYEELAAGLEYAEFLVAETALRQGGGLTEEQLQAVTLLNRQIGSSMYSDLINRSDLLLLLTHEQMHFDQEGAENQFRRDRILGESRNEQRIDSRSGSRDKALRSAFSTSLFSFAAAFTLWGLGEIQDRRYFSSATIDEATTHRRLFQVFSIGSVVGAAAGILSAGVSVALYARTR